MNENQDTIAELQKQILEMKKQFAKEIADMKTQNRKTQEKNDERFDQLQTQISAN
jgi:molybdopterin converting factor small subunit